MPIHFLDIADFDSATLKAILIDALAMKKDPRHKQYSQHLAGKHIALIFEKPSTRTRISFEVGVTQLGGVPLVLDAKSMQMGRGESLADTARVLSRYVHAMMLRVDQHRTLDELATTATIPVINGLSDTSHPCQVMADVMTLAEAKAPKLDFSQLTVLWAGDGNNVTHSWIDAAASFGFALRLACPPDLAPRADIIARAQQKGGRISFDTDISDLAKGVDAVVTDTWFSMGDGGDGGDAAADKKAREKLLAPYRITQAIMQQAKPDAVFMHCLPVYRGNEATAEVVDGSQSIIFDEAENRLHAQKAILRHCLPLPRP